MDQNNCRSYFKSSCRKSVFLLSLSWITGITLGTVLSFALEEYSVPLIRASVGCHISVAGLFCVVLLPILISYISFRQSKIWPIYFLAFVKGTCLGYCLLAMLLCYGTAAWLIHFLTTFSDVLTLVPLHYFWILLINEEKHFSIKRIRAYLIFAAFVGLVDYLLICPGVLSLV